MRTCRKLFIKKISLLIYYFEKVQINNKLKRAIINFDILNFLNIVTIIIELIKLVFSSDI